MKLDELQEAEGRSRAEAARMSFGWLSNDGKRADFHVDSNAHGGVVPFQSRADVNECIFSCAASSSAPAY